MAASISKNIITKFCSLMFQLLYQKSRPGPQTQAGFFLPLRNTEYAIRNTPYSNLNAATTSIRAACRAGMIAASTPKINPAASAVIRLLAGKI